MRTNKQRNSNSDSGENDWLMTYADAVTLLLAFFVLILAVSTLDQSKFELLIEALTQGKASNNVSAFDKIQQDINEIIESKNLEQAVTVERTPKGINIEFSSALFFDSGSEIIKDVAKPILQEVAYTLKEIEFSDFVIKVEGHTDNIPIKTYKIASNWELSAMRAANTIRYLITQGVNKKYLRAIGFADIRPKKPNMDEEGNYIRANQAKNRRVAIKVERIN
jgi:chemotaxis protein MotB